MSHHRLGYKPRYKKRRRRRQAGEESRFGTFDPPARGNEAASTPVSLAQVAYALGDLEFFRRRSRAASLARSAPALGVGFAMFGGAKESAGGPLGPVEAWPP